MIAPLVRLRLLSEPRPRRGSLNHFHVVRSATSHLSAAARIQELSVVWFSCTRGAVALPVRLARHDNGRVLMKKLALATAAVLALLSIAGCGSYVGKGKAPPPVVTKG